MILNCHKGLLDAIEARMTVWDENPDIGDIFEEKVRDTLEILSNNILLDWIC